MIIPEGGLNFDPPLRVFNMSGGVSCLVAKSGLCWLMLPSDYGSFWSELKSNTHQIAQIKTLRKITYHYFQNVEEMQTSPFEQTYMDVSDDNAGCLTRGKSRDGWAWLSLTETRDFI